VKPSAPQTYYEILGLTPSASVQDIKEAYAHAVDLYAPGSAAVANLSNAGDVEVLKARLLEAMEILTDEELRVEYDKSIGVPPRAPKDEEGGSAQLVMAELLARAEAVHSTHPEFQVSYIPHPPAPEPSALPEVRASAPPQPPAEPPSEPAPTPAPATERAEVAERAPAPLDQGQEVAAEAAVANAEAALAQVAVRVREARQEPRAKPQIVPPDGEFNGEVLRRVREARGLTLKALAEKTRITLKHLQNVEADRYDDLPAIVYLRGMLMSLARELALDPLKVAKSYVALVTGKTRGTQ